MRIKGRGLCLWGRAVRAWGTGRAGEGGASRKGCTIGGNTPRSHFVHSITSQSTGEIQPTLHTLTVTIHTSRTVSRPSAPGRSRPGRMPSAAPKRSASASSSSSRTRQPLLQPLPLPPLPQPQRPSLQLLLLPPLLPVQRWQQPRGVSSRAGLPSPSGSRLPPGEGPLRL